MKRSEINNLVKMASQCFTDHGWALPPKPRWDVTDFGLGDWRRFGLVLINLAQEPEYCEKLIYARAGMVTPAHAHLVKKEDIICRWGVLRVQLWQGEPDICDDSAAVQVNGEMKTMGSGTSLDLKAGERVTLVPGVYHSFWPVSAECIIGEVSTFNDDENDNVFHDPGVGRFSFIEEDEAPLVRLVSENISQGFSP